VVDADPGVQNVFHDIVEHRDETGCEGRDAHGPLLIQNLPRGIARVANGRILAH
jgi:hypothetical protein